MNRIDEYRTRLRGLKDWRLFLMRESGLPGPRGNLELAQAFAQEASASQILEYAGIGPAEAPENTPGAFVAFCGVLGLGTLIAAGTHSHLPKLRARASDPRWRIREAVAMALQLMGDSNMPALLAEMREWCRGNWYEQRAAAAALCEPRLLTNAAAANGTLRILGQITTNMKRAGTPRDEAFKTLRQGMSYCWSVAVAALPQQGRPLFEKWLDTDDPDIRWMLKENLGKARLRRVDAAWVRACSARLRSRPA